MKITEIKTYLMHAGAPGGGWSARNWLFVKIFTDQGIYGVGEASGVDIVEEAIARYPSQGNVSPPNPANEYVYFQARPHRARWLGK